MGSPAVNLAVYIALCVALPGVPWAILALVRRHHGREAERVGEPNHPPIEQIAADLRRVASWSRTLPEGSTYVRHRGAELAYDDLLISACRALQIPTELRDLPSGWERDVERLRVEACLIRAGMPIRRGRPG